MKIIYFDYWTKGIHNFESINKHLVKKGHDTMLFHIGSFRNVNQMKEEVINDILCRDISYYDTSLILKALKKIKPDVIVGLNTTYIMDRSLVLASRKLGFKTIFMMHGDRAIDENINKIVANSVYTFKRKILKAKKYFSLVIPNYIVSSWHYDKVSVLKLLPFKVLIATYKQPAKSNYYPPHSDEILFDKCLIYSNKYKDYYSKVGYNRDQIIVTGNPKNDLFFNLKSQNFPIEKITDDNLKKFLESEPKFALYLEDSYQEQRTYGWTYEYLSTHLQLISTRLKQESLNLVVKLHPTTDLNKIIVDDGNIYFFKSDLEYLISKSTICIAHTSSTVNLAILLEKPIIIPQWDKSQYIPDYYCNHGVANKWNNINDKLDYTTDKNRIDKYLEENITILKPVSNQLTFNEITLW